ncbi:MAG TPA: TetR/AcrR family transcriptional regulator [Vicinamibacteria bacterium]|nr:TetR/AcrR family transcriptional regulator [Vicinamibacteria bacterium]
MTPRRSSTATTPEAPSRQRERRDPAATRQALLAAGGALFSEQGYDAVPIEEVAARAGVNKALISYHFGGKRGLYGAILASAFETLAGRLAAAEARARSAVAALHGVIAAFDEFRREHPEFPGLFMREVLSSGVEPLAAPHLVSIIGTVRRIAARGAHEGSFRPVNPLLVHFALIGSLAFFSATERARMQAVVDGLLPFRMPGLPEFLRYVEELTVRGLAPDGAPGAAPGGRRRRQGGRQPGRVHPRQSKGARS